MSVVWNTFEGLCSSTVVLGTLEEWCPSSVVLGALEEWRPLSIVWINSGWMSSFWSLVPKDLPSVGVLGFVLETFPFALQEGSQGGGSQSDRTSLDPGLASHFPDLNFFRNLL